ncbi:hypothetical protein AB3R30_05870 [Leptolyngbyaceae cyanobacterium UHCC 1019]
MKLANPLLYPLSVLAGAVVLVAGVRLVNLPSWMVLPVAAAISTGGAMVQKAAEPVPILENPALEQELKSVRLQAGNLAAKANSLRQEASRLLTEANQMDLLVMVQSACDRAVELPTKIDQLSRRMHGADSLLAVEDLQQQLTEITTRIPASSGVARDQLNRLAESLRHNIQLARQGEDARQAQVLSLSTLILDSAGVLQGMQNQIRTANLTDAGQAEELRSLSNEFSLFQDHIGLITNGEG